jgi:hypothetical protein
VTAAQPDSTLSDVDDAPASPTLTDAPNPLSAHELYQLTLYKWRYSLEAYGFNHDEVRQLMFLKWLYASRRVLP